MLKWCEGQGGDIWVLVLVLTFTSESFRFEDQNEYEIYLKVFAHALKKNHPGKLHFTIFFPKRVSTVIYTGGG